MKLLVTGAGGQVGQDFLPLLVKKGHDVIAFDLAPPPEKLDKHVTWVRGDVSVAGEVHDVVRGHRPDRIYHFAAILSARGETMPHRTWRVNVEGTQHVLEAARLQGTPQVFFASTIAAFGPGLPDPVPNEVSMRPTTMYGVTKVTGELLGEYYRTAFGLDFRGVRFPGLISAGLPGGGTSDYALFMYVEGIRSGRYEAFCEPGTRIPFMYMPDALRGVLDLSEAPRDALGRSIYNIAAIHPTAEEVAAAVRERIPGVRLTFRPDARRQAILDSWPKRLDDTPAREDWGWAHRYDLAAMSDDLMRELRSMLDRGAIPATH
jgi:threonine 3-dehydrogenase